MQKHYMHSVKRFGSFSKVSQQIRDSVVSFVSILYVLLVKQKNVKKEKGFLH